LSRITTYELRKWKSTRKNRTTDPKTKQKILTFFSEQETIKRNHYPVTKTPSTTTNINAFLCQEIEQRHHRSKRNGVCVCSLWAKEKERVDCGSYVYFRNFRKILGICLFLQNIVEMQEEKCRGVGRYYPDWICLNWKEWKKFKQYKMVIHAHNYYNWFFSLASILNILLYSGLDNPKS